MFLEFAKVSITFLYTCALINLRLVTRKLCTRDEMNVMLIYISVTVEDVALLVLGVLMVVLFVKELVLNV